MYMCVPTGCVVKLRHDPGYVVKQYYNRMMMYTIFDFYRHNNFLGVECAIKN